MKSKEQILKKMFECWHLKVYAERGHFYATLQIDPSLTLKAIFLTKLFTTRNKRCET